MKFCMVGDLQEVFLRFEFHQYYLSGFGAVRGRNLSFLVDLAIGLYRIVIALQIKEVIVNAHGKLNKLMIAQTPNILPTKIITIG